MKYHLAIDIGASSGRHILGHVEKGCMMLEEIYRFDNIQVRKNGHDCWNTEQLWQSILEGLRACKAVNKVPETMGIDTWAVDFVLMGADGRPVSDAVAYRDKRTKGAMEQAERGLPFPELYARTGIQKQVFNTAYQLTALQREHPEQLAAASRLLMIPEYFNYLLTGNMLNEYTNATSTALVNAYTRSWDDTVIAALGLPRRIFGPLNLPGARVGRFTGEVQGAVGFDCDVLLPATHDTGSAFLAVPARDENAVYISSGTWSLVGIETLKPVISDEAQAANLTNEGGVDGTIRVLKNVMGLWIIQECQREWERRGKKLSFAEIVKEAEKEPAFRSLFDPDNDVFMTPGDMPGKIADYCCRTGQPVPETIGQTARAVYESLALKYRWTVKKLEKVRGKEIRALHIVGGGSNNSMLNQFTSDALGIPVITGPSEATAIGNLMMQAKALGLVKDMRELRRIVADSFETGHVEPGDRARWDEAYAKFLGIAGLSE